MTTLHKVLNKSHARLYDTVGHYMDSPRGQLADEVREVTWQILETVDVDAAERKLIWEDGRRLSIDESVQRIHAECPEYPVDLIEGRLISWLEMEFTPKDYSQEQMDAMDRLTEEWVDDVAILFRTHSLKYSWGLTKGSVYR